MSKGFDKLLDHFEGLFESRTREIQEVGKQNKYPYPSRVGGYGAFDYPETNMGDFGDGGGMGEDKYNDLGMPGMQIDAYSDGGGMGEAPEPTFYLEPETNSDMKAALYLLKKKGINFTQEGGNLAFDSANLAKDCMNKMRDVGVNFVIIDQLNDEAPAGYEGTVKALKRDKSVDNPYAVARNMQKKGQVSQYDDHNTTRSNRHTVEDGGKYGKPNPKKAKTKGVGAGGRQATVGDMPNKYIKGQKLVGG